MNQSMNMKINHREKSINTRWTQWFFPRGSRACRHAMSPLCPFSPRGSVANQSHTEPLKRRHKNLPNDKRISTFTIQAFSRSWYAYFPLRQYWDLEAMSHGVSRAKTCAKVTHILSLAHMWKGESNGSSKCHKFAEIWATDAAALSVRRYCAASITIP
jgi:hypothetical protein